MAMTVRIRAAAALLLVLAAVSATAGPCVYCSSAPPAPPDIPWRDDQVIPNLPLGSSSEPAAAAIGDRFVVAFVSDASGLGQVYVTWAGGIGCSWFEPLPLSIDPAEPSQTPAVAVTATDVVVVYVRQGVVYARHADLAPWPALVFEDEEALSSTDPLDPSASVVAANPAIAAVSGATGAQFFVAWEGQPAPAAGLTRIMFKKSLARGGRGTFTGADGVTTIETDLIAATGQPAFTGTASGSPAVSADTFGAGTTAVSLVFINDVTVVPPMGEKHPYFLRSIDAGQSFWGDVTAAPPSPVPTKIDGPAGPNVPALALDSSDNGLGGTDNWSYALWADDRRGNNRDIYSDAQAENGGAAMPPPGPAITRAFGADAGVETGNPQARDQVSATCVQLAGNVPAQGWAYFVYNRFGVPEVYFRRFNVQASGMTNGCGTGMGMATNPRPLTGLSPVRAAGNAQFPSAADSVVPVGPIASLPLQFVTWVDTRSGSPAIWWKSTDVFAPAGPTNVVARPAACPIEGFDITWDAATDCDVAGYIVSASDGTNPAITLNVPASPTAATLTNLRINTPYTVSVIAVDNACLQSVAAVTTATTADCPDAVVLTAVPPVLPQDGDDQCNAPAPNGDGNGQVEPNEIVRNVKLRIQNGGPGTAVGVQGTLRQSLQVQLGSLSSGYIDIGPAGGGADVQPNTTDFDFYLPGMNCPMNPVNLVLTMDVTAPPQVPSATLTWTFVVPSAGGGCVACNTAAQLTGDTLDPATDIGDGCGGGGPGNDDDFPDPGESISLKLPLVNLGTTPATNINVVGLTSPTPGVTIVSPLSTYPDAQPGMPPPGAPVRNQSDFVITLDAAYDCVANPAVELDLQILDDQRLTPQTLRFTLPTNPAGCNACVGTCPGTIPEVTAVHGVKAAADVVLDWAAQGSAIGGYNVWYVTAAASIDQARRGGSGQSLPACTEPSPATGTTCTHAGARDGAAGTVHFYQVRAICGAAEGL